MDGIINNSGIYISSVSAPESGKASGFSMGRDITAYNKNKFSLLNLPPGAGAGQSPVSKEESHCVQDISGENVCVFSRCVSPHNETKVDSRLLSDVDSETSDFDKKCMSERSLAKSKDKYPCPLELSISKLKEETICHTTAAVLKKNFSNNYSEPCSFTLDEQHMYKEYINKYPEHDYLFVHSLKCKHLRTTIKFHDFVILRKGNNFHILQSMAGAFSLNQWITGDPSTINKRRQKNQKDNDLILFHRKIKYPSPFSKKKEDNVIKLMEELKKTEPSFDKILKTRKNKPCSKAIFNQKILPTLFSVLKNSDDQPYFRIFSVSRRFLEINPEDKMFLEVSSAKL